MKDNARKQNRYTDQIGRVYHGMAKTITFQVTDKCNLACTYCYQINKGTHRMPLETGKKMVDALFEDKSVIDYLENEEMAGIILDFIGGEPLLEVELIDQIIDYFILEAVKRNHRWLTRFRVSISTNGTLYFTGRVQRFIKKHAAHLSLGITLDGNKALHDKCRVFPDGAPSYDIVEAAVKDAMKRYEMYSTKLTIAPANVEYLSEAIEHLADLGFVEIFANTVFEEGWKPEHAKIYYQQLKKVADMMLERDDVACRLFNEHNYEPLPETNNSNWCGGTGKMLAVDYKGDLFPCLRYMESSLGEDCPPMVIGNLETGIGRTCAEKECITCLKSITRRSQSTDECFNCPIAAGCAWCSAYNYQVFGTPNKRATFTCEMHKAASFANVYYWNRYYLKEGIEKVKRLNCPDEWALAIVSGEELEMLKGLAERNEER